MDKDTRNKITSTFAQFFPRANRDGFTRQEFERVVKCSRSTATQKIYEMVQRKEIEFFGWRIEKRRDGYRSKVPVYRFTPNGKGKKKCG